MSPEGVKANWIITKCIREWSQKYLKIRPPIANWIECEHGAVRVFKWNEMGEERRCIAEGCKASEYNWGEETEAEGYVMTDGSPVLRCNDRVCCRGKQEWFFEHLRIHHLDGAPIEEDVRNHHPNDDEGVTLNHTGGSPGCALVGSRFSSDAIGDGPPKQIGPKKYPPWTGFGETHNLIYWTCKHGYHTQVDGKIDEARDHLVSDLDWICDDQIAHTNICSQPSCGERGILEYQSNCNQQQSLWSKDKPMASQEIDDDLKRIGELIKTVNENRAPEDRGSPKGKIHAEVGYIMLSGHCITAVVDDDGIVRGLAYSNRSIRSDTKLLTVEKAIMTAGLLPDGLNVELIKIIWNTGSMLRTLSDETEKMLNPDWSHWSEWARRHDIGGPSSFDCDEFIDFRETLRRIAEYRDRGNVTENREHRDDLNQVSRFDQGLTPIAREGVEDKPWDLMVSKEIDERARNGPYTHPCCRVLCPCTQSHNGNEGEYCCITCRRGRACRTNVHYEIESVRRDARTRVIAGGGIPTCVRPGCPCTSTYDNTIGEYCSKGCKEGFPCETNRHFAPFQTNSGAKRPLSYEAADATHQLARMYWPLSWALDGGPPLCGIDYILQSDGDGSVSVTYPTGARNEVSTFWNKQLETSNLRRLAKNGNARARGIMRDIRNGITRPASPPCPIPNPIVPTKVENEAKSDEMHIENIEYRNAVAFKDGESILDPPEDTSNSTTQVCVAPGGGGNNGEPEKKKRTVVTTNNGERVRMLTLCQANRRETGDGEFTVAKLYTRQKENIQHNARAVRKRATTDECVKGYHKMELAIQDSGCTGNMFPENMFKRSFDTLLDKDSYRATTMEFKTADPDGSTMQPLCEGTISTIMIDDNQVAWIVKLEGYVFKEGQIEQPYISPSALAVSWVKQGGNDDFGLTTGAPSISGISMSRDGWRGFFPSMVEKNSYFGRIYGVEALLEYEEPLAARSHESRNTPWTPRGDLREAMVNIDYQAMMSGTASISEWVNNRDKYHNDNPTDKVMKGVAVYDMYKIGEMNKSAFWNHRIRENTVIQLGIDGGIPGDSKAWKDFSKKEKTLRHNLGPGSQNPGYEEAWLVSSPSHFDDDWHTLPTCKDTFNKGGVDWQAIAETMEQDPANSYDENNFTNQAVRTALKDRGSSYAPSNACGTQVNDLIEQDIMRNRVLCRTALTNSEDELSKPDLKVLSGWSSDGLTYNLNYPEHKECRTDMPKEEHLQARLPISPEGPGCLGWLRTNVHEVYSKYLIDQRCNTTDANFETASVQSVRQKKISKVANIVRNEKLLCPVRGCMKNRVVIKGILMSHCSKEHYLGGMGQRQGGTRKMCTLRGCVREISTNSGSNEIPIACQRYCTRQHWRLDEARRNAQSDIAKAVRKSNFRYRRQTRGAEKKRVTQSKRRLKTKKESVTERKGCVRRLSTHMRCTYGWDTAAATQPCTPNCGTSM